MRIQIGGLICSAMIGLAVLSSPSLAQQKTVRACQEEWRANRTANEAAGITQRAYVEKCRASATTAQPATAPTSAAPRPAATTSSPTAPAAAGQKTVRACQEEWKANRAANQAAGITQKAYVEKCRAGTTTAQPATSPTPAAPRPAATTTAPGAPSAQKTVRACQEEWRANRAANQAAGITQKAYVENCRAGTTTAQPTTSPTPVAPRPATTTTAPTAAPPAARAPAAGTPTGQAPAAPRPAATTTAPVAPSAAPRAATRAPATGTPTGAGQFATEGQAKARCPGDTVVWVNLDSKIYHFAGYKDYGNTKSGAYMCERDTGTEGFRAAKNEKHP
jgi:hypothetical protein